MGHIRFLVFYLLSGIAPNAINFLVNIDSTIPELGASAAIAGVMGETRRRDSILAFRLLRSQLEGFVLFLVRLKQK